MGAASAVKMSYAGINKGLAAIAAEMREIAEFAGSGAATPEVFPGVAELFERLSRDAAGEQRESAALTGFFTGRK